MKKLLLSIAFVFALCSIARASDINIFKRVAYDLSLESKEIKAGSSTVEYFDIDNLSNKIPDQIFATVESGNWVSSLPGNVFVSDSSNNTDSITEYWEVNFAKVKNGRVVFSRIIINNSTEDKDSYAWNIKIKCKYVKFR